MIEAQCPQGNVQEGKRLMIIELERYNKFGELLIEIGITGHRDMYAIRTEAGECL